MRYDKIVHYIGADICNNIAQLTAEQLKERKKALISDMNIDAVKKDVSIFFKRTIELEYINNLLK